MSLHSDRMIAGILERVEEGQPILTEDEHEIGKVAGIEHQCVKVSVTLSRDYWLAGDSIVDVTDEGVRVCFAKSDLGAYKLDKPALSDDPVVAQEDEVIPVQEQLEQRERMERELEEQRRAREDQARGAA